MILSIYIALALVGFLAALNGFLHGAKKIYIDSVLSVLMLGLIVVMFVIEGWKLGLLAIVVAFVAAFLTRPLAARVASRLFSISTRGIHGGYVGLPLKTLERISQRLGHKLDSSSLADEVFGNSDKRTQAIEALLDYCTALPEIQRIMSDCLLTRLDLKKIYFQLVAAGAGQWTCGHWVAASSIAYPDTLKYVITRKTTDADMKETAYNLIMHFEQGLSLDADYMDTEQYLGSSACADFTEAEREVIRLELAAFSGQRLHPEIAGQMFGAITSAALANYATRLISQNSGDIDASTLAFAALDRATRCFQHPELLNRIAELLDAQNQPEGAKTARQTALMLQKTRKPSEFDPLFLQNLHTWPIL